MTWGFEAVTSASLTLNRSMFGTFTLLSLALTLWLRYRYGPEQWHHVALKVAYAILGFIATGLP